MTQDERIRRAKRRLLNSLISAEGLTGVGIDRDPDGEPFLVVFAADATCEAAQKAPDSWERFPVRLVVSGALTKKDG